MGNQTASGISLVVFDMAGTTVEDSGLVQQSFLAADSHAGLSHTDADREEMLPSTVRWFEDRFTTTPEWPDECYVNHSFAPNGVWHLGFIFAARELEPGEELTYDYRLTVDDPLTKKERAAYVCRCGSKKCRGTLLREKKKKKKK